MNSDVRGDPVEILLVEGSPGDVRLVEEAFKDARIRNEIHTVGRGDDALDYLRQRGEYADADRPDIVLLDPDVPGADGKTVVAAVRDAPDLPTVPVVVLTSSAGEADIDEGVAASADASLQKPIDVEEFVDVARSVCGFWVLLVNAPAGES